VNYRLTADKREIKDFLKLLRKLPLSAKRCPKLRAAS